MQRRTNANHLVNLGNITNINLTLNVVNEITTKRRQTSRASSVPYQHQSLGIKVALNRLMHLISTAKKSNSIQRRFDLPNMVIMIA
jgi:hypothetical protein